MIGFVVVGLILTTAFSTAIFVARRVSRVAWAYPLGILAGMTVLLVSYLLWVSLIIYGVFFDFGLINGFYDAQP